MRSMHILYSVHEPGELSAAVRGFSSFGDRRGRASTMSARRSTANNNRPARSRGSDREVADDFEMVSAPERRPSAWRIGELFFVLAILIQIDLI